MPYRAEYIWIDGRKPTSYVRSKTKIVASGQEPPLWGFDGSSTDQAPGELSDCVLRPVFVRPDPIRGGENVLVMCEVLTPDMEPHPSNTRASCVEVYEQYKDQEPWFGLEQEYTFFKDGRPHGWPIGGFPAPQGGYYCGVGADEIWGRDVVENHTVACMEAGLEISGTNAEVMIGQWEFQIGPLDPVAVGDHLWMARWLLYRLAEDCDISAHLNPKPVEGDWNGAGMHANFSTAAMRESYDPIIAACEALGTKADEHVESYGAGIQRRLTGLHETAPWTEYSYGVSNRGASVRIPWQTARDQKGYIEDRRPNANADPYVVARLMTETICSVLADE
ncbi:MAG: glutamine synthetase GlnII [Acidimicrobiia bacterium]